MKRRDDLRSYNTSMGNYCCTYIYTRECNICGIIISPIKNKHTINTYVPNYAILVCPDVCHKIPQISNTYITYTACITNNKQIELIREKDKFGFQKLFVSKTEKIESIINNQGKND